jgi:hypothetical protein
MNFRNFTAHNINFFRREDVYYISNIRKYVVKDDVAPYLTVPSEGMLSVAYENELVDEAGEVPVYRKLVLRLDRLPEAQEGDVVIVSMPYASYRKQTDCAPYPLYTIHETVYDKSGKPVGCLGLVKN